MEPDYHPDRRVKTALEPPHTSCRVKATVPPGFIHTPLTDAQAADLNEVVIASTPMKRGGLPIEIAYGCLFLASDEASYITGAELVIDGGYLAQ